MATPGFVHLHTHSEFSVLDGAARIGDLIEAAKHFEMPALALTDHGVMYGNITFYSECEAAGIKPIMGCEVYVAPRGRTQRDARLDKEQHHLVLLARNEKGYKNLIKLVSTAFSEGFYYKPRVDKELLAAYSSDLIALTSCLKGEVPSLIARGDQAGAQTALEQYCDIFGRENVYLEVMDHDLPEQKPVNEGIVRLAETTGLKIVATNDIHYATRKDADAHDVLLCIQTGSNLNDANRMRFGTREFYLKSGEEMAKKLGHIPGAIENTLEVAERCNCKFEFGQFNLPDPGVPQGVESGDYMREQALQGLMQRLGGDLPEEYRKQFDYECDIINSCKFPTYMLIVRDFTDFARRQGIYVGVRGSAAGSLVCYGLGITDVDPMEYGLTFERFLNPERAEMPDVDLDIQDDRRDDLIQYVCDKYGRDRVGQIATFGSLKARAAIRDCGRVLGMNLADVDKICKMVPGLPVGITIDQALEENPEMQSTYDSNGEARALIDMARTLEGLNRSVGVHAAGVLISDDPLTDHVPVHSGNKGETVAQMALKDIKKVGLLKMDFLGLANLTILANAVANVKRHHDVDIDILNIPLEDSKTFEMLGRGDTNGVFQLEGAGMRRNVVELKPRSIRELAAIVALYRPGPMDHIPKFIKSKFGQVPITYLHPDLEPILEETYGVICYQDQVLRIAQAIAGFTLGQADVLRKAMSSKDPKTMAKQEQLFFDGAKNKGVPPKVAIEIYKQIRPFAGYAFNKAHAVCYAFVAYRTAYMKANYPAEYYAALLSANMDDKDKLGLYIEDCRRLGIQVLPPDVNSSGVEFEVEAGSIRFGMGAVKGCGRAVVEAIVEARQSGGKFVSLFDFCERVHHQTGVNKSTVECLIKVGAFSSINSNHALLLEMLPDAVNAAAAKLRESRSGQGGLFGMEPDSVSYAPDMSKYGHIGDFSHDEILAMEKDLLGVYISGHPLDDLRSVLDQRCSANSQSLQELQHDQECTIGGIIADLQVRMTKRGDKMAQVKLEDLYGTIPVTFFPQTYKTCADQLAKDKIVLIKGKASHRERIAADEENAMVEVEVRGESVSPLANENGIKNNGGNGSRSVHIKIDGSTDLKLDLLKTLIENNPGPNRVYFWMCHCGDRRKIATPFKVSPSKDFLSNIERLLGKDVVKVG